MLFDLSLIALAFKNTGCHRFVEHAFHLCRDTGQCKNACLMAILFRQAEIDSWCRSLRIENLEASLGKHCLNPIAVGHVAFAPREHLFNVFHR